MANTHRGFGFIEFEVEDDAKAAVENMDGEMWHRTRLSFHLTHRNGLKRWLCGLALPSGAADVAKRQ